MKHATLLLFLAIQAVAVFSQSKEYIYTNAEHQVEIKFPAAPFVGGSRVEAPSATLNLSVEGGLAYQIIIQKNNILTNYISLFKDLGAIVKSKYDVGKIKVTEMELQRQGVCYRYKIVKYEGSTLLIYVSSQTCAQDKDVLPFFNSLKINGELVQNPNTDNSKYTVFNIDYPSKARVDTVTKIVYVNADLQRSYQFEKLSDVDKNIPQGAASNPYCFALVIGNEDYSSHQQGLKTESNVEFARNDASAFRDYCRTTLGIPDQHITFMLDATVGQMNQGFEKLKLLSKACGGKAQLIVYYAGHGLPEEVTNEPYLIPVDVSGASVTAGIKLQDVYASLTTFPSERITVYLDACFTGGGRNAGLLASRGVKVRPKADQLAGNIVVYSSSSGEQSSLPYTEQKHGMFTYFLLKKLQESKGDLTYAALFDFLNEKVPIESLLVNSKEQNPVVNTSQDVADKWKSWKLK
ncbi:MAG TPA: caspase family protein [Williamwhitmania sp.]|nr:caspase family protein [Williamwhitmania sp.]